MYLLKPDVSSVESSSDPVSRLSLYLVALFSSVWVTGLLAVCIYSKNGRAGE